MSVGRTSQTIVRAPDDADLFTPRPVLARLVVRFSPDPRVSRISNRGRHSSRNHGTVPRARGLFSAAADEQRLRSRQAISRQNDWTEDPGSATDLLSCDGRKPGGNGFEKAGSIAAESRQLQTKPGLDLLGINSPATQELAHRWGANHTPVARCLRASRLLRAVSTELCQTASRSSSRDGRTLAEANPRQPGPVSSSLRHDASAICE
jgi:hypothetical protein